MPLRCSSRGLDNDGEFQPSSSADDCLKLTNTSEQAYSLLVNATNFGVAAVEEIGNSMNSLISCSQDAFIEQLKCVFNQLQAVRTQVLDLQQQFLPYANEGKVLYYELVEELEECL
ncbi:hypothetical protein GE061_006081 [Apolygus lucorum]|uniref:Uncharacterized protein n=1 Tax=Apolygus lucorum TaxID=248454 RepID=A0A8S9WSZ4_APOLU|nr:hypothetical protein GE061_006081 [Apolygus lucorum]